MLKIVNEGSFDKEVLKNDKVVLVDFYADWCGPCRMIAPVLEKIASENTDFDIAKVDVEANENLARTYGIMAIPTLHIMKNGEILDTINGFIPESMILDKIRKHI